MCWARSARGCRQAAVYLLPSAPSGRSGLHTPGCMKHVKQSKEITMSFRVLVPTHEITNLNSQHETVIKKCYETCSAPALSWKLPLVKGTSRNKKGSVRRSERLQASQNTSTLSVPCQIAALRIRTKACLCCIKILVQAPEGKKNRTERLAPPLYGEWSSLPRKVRSEARVQLPVKLREIQAKEKD